MPYIFWLNCIGNVMFVMFVLLKKSDYCNVYLLKLSKKLSKS